MWSHSYSQIQSSGGPKPQISISYSISDDTIAEVSDSGMILAKQVGTAVVTGKIEIGDPTMSQPTSFSQDTVHVRVVKLTGVKIHLPTPRSECKMSKENLWIYSSFFFFLLQRSKYVSTLVFWISDVFCGPN